MKTTAEVEARAVRYDPECLSFCLQSDQNENRSKSKNEGGERDGK